MGFCESVTMNRQSLIFDNAAAAVRFADGLLHDPHVKISMRDGVGGGNYEDVRSLAETISLELELVPKPAGPMFRFVHGRYIRRMWLADHLMQGAGAKAEGNRTVTGYRIVALLAMEEKKRRAHGQILTVTEVARMMHLPRRTFYDRWSDVYTAMQKEAGLLLDQADRALTARLEGLHIIGQE